MSCQAVSFRGISTMKDILRSHLLFKKEEINSLKPTRMSDTASESCTSLLSHWHRDDGAPVMGFRVHPSHGHVLWYHQDLYLVLSLPHAAQQSLPWMLELSQSHPREVFLRAFLKQLLNPPLVGFIARTEDRYSDHLFCPLRPPNLFPFDLPMGSGQTDVFCSKTPETAGKKETS